MIFCVSTERCIFERLFHVLVVMYDMTFFSFHTYTVSLMLIALARRAAISQSVTQSSWSIWYFLWGVSHRFIILIEFLLLLLSAIKVCLDFYFFFIYFIRKSASLIFCFRKLFWHANNSWNEYSYKKCFWWVGGTEYV